MTTFYVMMELRRWNGARNGKKYRVRLEEFGVKSVVGKMPSEWG